MILKKYILLFLLCSSVSGFTQQIQLSPKAEISVITCSPGEELYASFGHTAFRVYDPVLGIDKAYNYGIFDFNKPNFYLNFAKGKLIYELGTSHFSRFLRVYQYEGREVKAQVLNLSAEDVQHIYNFLEENAKPENKSYKYDFFYDNCATKIPEVIEKILKDKFQLQVAHLEQNKSHRTLIKDYAGKNKWGQFGIDLALGSVIDDKATATEYLFLPDHVFSAFQKTTIYNNEQLVKETITILKPVKFKKESQNLLSPTIIFSFLLILTGFFTHRDYKNKKRSKWVDFSLFFISGSIGILVLVLWFATDHTATYRNFNFLWAFAPNVIVAFYLLKNNVHTWIQFYCKVLLLLLAVLLVLWILKIQVFNLAIIPILLLLIVRYTFLVKRS